jgi:hypothetical protein
MSRYHAVARIAAVTRSWIGHHEGHEIEVEYQSVSGVVFSHYEARLVIDGKLRDHVKKLPAVLRADLSESAAPDGAPLVLRVTIPREPHGLFSTGVRATIGGQPFALERVKPGKPYGKPAPEPARPVQQCDCGYGGDGRKRNYCPRCGKPMAESILKTRERAGEVPVQRPGGLWSRLLQKT